MEEESLQEGCFAHVVDSRNQVNTFQVSEGQLAKAPKITDFK